VEFGQPAGTWWLNLVCEHCAEGAVFAQVAGEGSGVDAGDAWYGLQLQELVEGAGRRVV